MSSPNEEARIVENLGILVRGKLRANAFKDHWSTGCTDEETRRARVSHLIDLAMGEIGEARTAFDEGEKVGAIILELADVAAMMALAIDVMTNESPDNQR